jgi:hypothetical protein
MQLIQLLELLERKFQNKSNLNIIITDFFYILSSSSGSQLNLIEINFDDFSKEDIDKALMSLFSKYARHGLF